MLNSKILSISVCELEGEGKKAENDKNSVF